MRIYIKKKTPGVSRELDQVKDTMAGGICIVDNLRILVKLGTGKEDAVAFFSESEGLIRFFSLHYNLIVDRAKKPK
ncbi:MAG: hypothetical protein WCF90_09550 [Methanomicrobiales archaeon]